MTGKSAPAAQHPFARTPARKTRRESDVTSGNEPALSVLIATRNRAAQLGQVLDYLAAARAAAPTRAEIIVIDNGSTDDTAARLARWRAGGSERVDLYEPQPGKSRALNRGLEVARAPVLVFTDDDVVIPPNWIGAVGGFFADHPEYDGAMGPVRVPPDVTDPGVLARLSRWGTLPLFDRGTATRDLREMYGCNMAVRRRAFDKVGRFDARLGVGASGLCEDTELAERMCRAGLRIGYMPEAVIYHTVDPERLTHAAFREFHIRWARSRVVMDPPQPWQKNLARFVDAALAVGWWTMLRNPRRRLQAWARMVRHREMLRLRRLAG